MRTTAQRISSIAIVLGALTVGCLWSQAAYAQGATGTTSWTIGYAGSGHAGPITTWTAPRTGYYSVRAYGGSGGGFGAVIGGTFLLESGTTLHILVGGGNTRINSGAGGTFVVTSSTTPLVVAGGGGGLGEKVVTDWNSINASLTTAGNDAYYGGANQQGSGGTNGSGGTIGSNSTELGGAGGGGFYGNGGTHLINAAIDHGEIAAQGGFSYVNGGFGGYDNVSNDRTAFSQAGYFGGGGQSGGSSTSYNPGGGGGGYSGGGGGGFCNDPNGAGTANGSGGGGGSYLDASAFDVVKYINNSSISNFTYNGMVSISEITSARLTSGTTAQATVAIGTAGISDESLFVSNPGTLLTSSSNVVVGLSTAGNSMVISGGGRVVNAVSGVIGSNAGASSNSVTVSGSGSNWTSSGSLVVGSSGTGNSLVVSSGGMVQTGSTPTSTVLGYNAGSSNNSVVVTGSGSIFTNYGAFVGYAGTGNSLVITNGGSMQSGDSDAVIGYDSSSAANSVQVTGAGSSLTGGKIEVGSGGSGSSLVISNGGYVSSSSGQIGSKAGSTGNSVLATGSGSSWQATVGIQVGGSGAGTLTVADGGNVTATQTTIAEFAGSSGALNIGGFSQSDAAGTISTPTIAFGAGSGSINFNQSNSTTVSSTISGNGAVYQLGSGTTVLSGQNTYTGTTTVANGRLSVNGSLGNTSVVVLAGAELGGTGSIAGPVSIAAGGSLAPGNSIGAHATGGVSFAAGAKFEYEFDSSLLSSLGSAADLLVVNGHLNLDPAHGTLLTLTDLNTVPVPFVANTTTFALINYSGTWNGGLFNHDGIALANGSRFMAGAQEWQIDYDRASAAGIDNFTGNFVSGAFVTITAVPEPSTYAMALAGLACGGYSMWRRRKRA